MISNRMPPSEMGLDHNSYVWRNAVWSADISKMACALDAWRSNVNVREYSNPLLFLASNIVNCYYAAMGLT